MLRDARIGAKMKSLAPPLNLVDNATPNILLLTNLCISNFNLNDKIKKNLGCTGGAKGCGKRSLKK